MILDMKLDGYDSNNEQAKIIVNASLGKILGLGDYDFSDVRIISFDSFSDVKVCTSNKIKEFLERHESICPKLEIIDLSRACSPSASLESVEFIRLGRFIQAFKKNTNIDIVVSPEQEKLFPILTQEEENDKFLENYAIPLKEEKYSSLQAITKLQFAQAERKLSPELCLDILEHCHNNFVTQRVISAIDTQLSKENEQLDQYIPTLLGCIAGRYVSPDNFNAIVDIAEKYILLDHITTEDINFCFGLQEESSQSKESYQRINNLIKKLIPHLPEDVRQDLDAKAALKEKKKQEYIQKRQSLQERVNEYSGYLLLSDAINENVSGEHIRRIGDTIDDNIENYSSLYEKILDKIDKEQDEYKIKAASHWIEPMILRINALHQDETDVEFLKYLTKVVTKNQDVRLEYGHIFCQQLNNDNNSEFWIEKIKTLLDTNSTDHILLMNTYEDMKQAYKLHPELIPESLAIFKRTLGFNEISKGFNNHLHTLASIIGDTAQDHPEFTDNAIEILSDLINLERKLGDSPARIYLHSKIDEAFNKIKQNDLTPHSRRNLTVIQEKDQIIFADVVKELMNDTKTKQQHIENSIETRLNNGLDVLINDYDSPECLKWNLAVLRSKALQKKGSEEISACAEKIFKNAVLTQLEDNQNYDPSEIFKAFYDAAPFWLNHLRENISDKEDLLIIQHFDRIPKEAQKLYIGEYTGKMDNLIATDNLKNFPEIAAQKFRSEVCDYTSDISGHGTYEDERSLSGMEKWATVLKEIDGYSSPEVCVIALNAALLILKTISHPTAYSLAARACAHFLRTNEDIKQFVKISTDIIDKVFEQIRRQKDTPFLAEIQKKADSIGWEGRTSLQESMGTEATDAFLSGDESYKDLWDKRIVSVNDNAYLLFEKRPSEILQDTPFDEKIEHLGKIKRNTYVNGYVEHYYEYWKWMDFPELFSAEELLKCFPFPYRVVDEDVVKAVKIFCKARINDTKPECDISLLTILMNVYNEEYKKGIEDKELFSVLYKLRFSEANKVAQKYMQVTLKDYNLTAPKLESLCKTSHGVLKWRLKPSENEK